MIYESEGIYPKPVSYDQEVPVYNPTTGVVGSPVLNQSREVVEVKVGNDVMSRDHLSKGLKTVDVPSKYIVKILRQHQRTELRSIFHVPGSANVFSASELDPVIKITRKSMLLYCERCKRNVKTIKDRDRWVILVMLPFSIISIAAVVILVGEIDYNGFGTLLLKIILVVIIVSLLSFMNYSFIDSEFVHAAHLCPRCKRVLFRAGDSVRLHAV